MNVAINAAMTRSSQLLRRAFVADAVFSGVAAVLLTADADALAALLGSCPRGCCARPVYS
ncbi:MAG: hypothetical protein V7634_2922 [Bradyrhizobium sp.]